MRHKRSTRSPTPYDYSIVRNYVDLFFSLSWDITAYFDRINGLLISYWNSEARMNVISLDWLHSKKKFTTLMQCLARLDIRGGDDGLSLFFPLRFALAFVLTHAFYLRTCVSWEAISFLVNPFSPSLSLFPLLSPHISFNSPSFDLSTIVHLFSLAIDLCLVYLFRRIDSLVRWIDQTTKVDLTC